MNLAHRRSPARTAALAAAVILLAVPLVSLAEVKFAVSFPAERSKIPLDGRMLLLLSTNDRAEP
ncbi:MAG: hypothetical protein HGA24_05425, partial [Candidatus Aminicenantes bacterium]|nr:hypothetical protein [Candidatus Aminicenantes bacterium]